jgi:hypothetical protein
MRKNLFNSAGHFMPLLYALGLQRDDDEVLSTIPMVSLQMARQSEDR